jgi:L-cysteine S-thiosulfotransferase
MKQPSFSEVLVGTLTLGGALNAQSNQQAELDKYRQMLQDGNPADLVSAKGEGLWKAIRGPKAASLEKCDVGLGPGVVKDAYAQLPRYFADTDQVMDFESRLVHCMVSLHPHQSAILGRRAIGHGSGSDDVLRGR